jgi:hypothetical protein
LYVSVEFDVAAPTSWRSENKISVVTTAARIPDRFIHSPYVPSRIGVSATIGRFLLNGMISATLLNDQAGPA